MSERQYRVVSGESSELLRPYMAGAAFAASPATETLRVIDDAGVVIASTRSLGQFRDGSPRFVKHVAEASAEDRAEFRVGVVVRLADEVRAELCTTDWKQAAPAASLAAPNLPERLYDKLEVLAKQDFVTAAFVWIRDVPAHFHPPTFVDPCWKLQVLGLKEASTGKHSPKEVGEVMRLIEMRGSKLAASAPAAAREVLAQTLTAKLLERARASASKSPEVSRRVPPSGRSR